MIPKHFHVTHLSLYSFSLLNAAVNEVRVTEFLSSVTEVVGLCFKISDFIINNVKLSKGLFTTAIVLVEVTLLKFLGESLHFFFKLDDLVVVLLGFRGNKGSDLFFDVFS